MVALHDKVSVGIDAAGVLEWRHWYDRCMWGR